MIVQEIIANTNLIKTYSDSGMLIEQQPTKNLYAEAIDVQNASYIYVETDIPIDNGTTPDDEEEEEATAADYEAALNKLGVNI